LRGRSESAASAAPCKARSESQKAQVVFSDANLDGIRSISGESVVHRITFNGQTWKLGKSEYDLQREEFARQEREAGISEFVQSALAETLESGGFPDDFSAFFNV
jgi:hypothetical protein